MTGNSRVLLAESNDKVRSSLAAALREAGCDLVEARDTAELLARLGGRAHGEAPYDLIICSADLPALDEIGVVEFLSDPRLASTIVLLTAGNYLAAAARALRIGATALLRWPRDVGQLSAVLRGQLQPLLGPS